MSSEHGRIYDMLDRFMDDELPETERLEVVAHVEGCRICAEEVESIRSLLDEADALPGEIAVPRDLWAGIVARIEAERSGGGAKVIELKQRERPSAARVDPWVPRIAAAIALVVISSTVTALLLTGPDDGQETAAAVEGNVPAERPMTTLAAFAPAEAQYRSDIQALAAEFDARRGQLAPETIAVIEANLKIIDDAIAEASAALRSDPSSLEVPRLLTGVYQRKLELLQQAVQLPSEV